MKSILLFLCIGLHTLCYCQVAPSPQADIPNILPPSPTASDLGRYALVSSNMSSGGAKSSIPLYTYKTRNLSLPISLDYNSDGFKVDQVSSRVGTGWTLNSGGAISRTVLGSPDGGGFVNPPIDFPGTTGSALDSYINTSTNGYDTQADIFTFNFCGNFGRFIIYDGGIKKLEQNNLKIEGDINGGFIITSADGIKYQFTSIESSSSVNSLNPKYRVEIKNAWFLTRIIHPLGDFIALSYSNCEFKYMASTNQTFIYFDYSSFDGPDLQPTETRPTDKEVHSYTVINNKGVYLSGISSNSATNGYLKFNYEERADLVGDFYLLNVGLYRSQNPSNADIPLQNIQLNYNTITPSSFYKNQYTNYVNNLNVNKRLFLNAIIVNDKKYLFEYNNLDKVPPRLSFSQDHYGYFNGKNNKTLIPEPVNPIIADAFRYEGYGDRSPDFTYAKIGLLNRITFPTGASENIDYEANSLYMAMDKDCDIPDSTFSIYKEATSTLKHNTTVYSEPFTVTCTSTVKVQIGCVPMNRASSGQPSYPAGEYLVNAGLADAEDYLLGFTQFNDGQAVVDQHNVIYVTFQPGTYRLAVKVRGDARGYCMFTYANSYPFTGNKEVAGVRVKRVITFDPITAKQTVKNYNYNNLIDGHSSGKMISEKPVYQSRTRTFSNYGSYSYVTKNYLKFSSGNVYGISDLTGNHIYYDRVVESTGDNYENGGIEHVFLNAVDGYPSALMGNFIEGVTFSNTGINSHQEIEQNNFIKRNNEYLFLKRVKTTYLDDTRLRAMYPFYVFSADPGGTNLNLPKNNLGDYVYLNVNQYNLFSRWTYPIKTETILYDSNGQQPISSVEEYQYENTDHQLLTKTIQKNSDGKVHSNVNRYAHDMVASGNTIPYQEMINRHIFNPVIEYEELTDGLKQQKIIKEYRRGWDVNDFILPETIKSQFKNNDVETRLQYYRYDENGNPLEIAKANGPKISYLWAYDKSLLIAEVKNSNFTNVENILGGKSVADAFLLKQLPSEEEVRSFLLPLRSHIGLSNSLISSYIYDPLVGIKVSTDSKNLDTFFDYDLYQRLLNVKDRNQNIVKNYRYNFLINDPIWEATGNKKCLVDINNKNTGIEEAEQKDINPISVSYNNLRWVSLGKTNACPVDVPCQGIDHKVINGECVEGTKVYTSSVKNGVRGTTYTCVYHYEWTDGTRSIDFVDETHNGPCTILQ
ncbi:hypothetical protein OQX63_23095 [Pedobacter sp. PF22-3]|uniref:hypothetical protein n=1 Tax=Pedobacter sp. PF22-3 TaxID=2994467 RepID=UPI0022485993|nr:hypothetical protein [Pedobacter sp. PF22-3]MCX2496396.1 hypothetical protein [Pedobacter sp. PF22-3]